MNIHYVIASRFIKWQTNFNDFRFKWKTTAAIGTHSTKAWLSKLVNFKNAIWTWGHFRRTICNKIVLNFEKMPQKHMECFRLLFHHVAWIEHQFLSGIRNSRKVRSLWGMMRGVEGVRKSIHQSSLAKRLGLGLGLLKGVQEEIPLEEASTFQIGSVAFPPGQCTSPQLHPCHRLFDQDGHQDKSSPSLKSRPCSLWLLGIFWPQRPRLYETLEEMKEAVTKVIDTLTQEDFYGTFQKLLERYNKCIAAGGDYFEGD